MRRDSDAIVVPCGAHETNKLPMDRMDVEICVRDLCAPRPRLGAFRYLCFETPSFTRPRPCRDRVYSRFRRPPCETRMSRKQSLVVCVAEADALTTRIASSDSHSGAFTSVPGAFPRLLWFRGPRL